MELAGKTVLVLGLGDTGLSMARWLARRGARLRLADTRTTPPHAETAAREFSQVPIHLGPLSDATFAGVDLIAISPGVPLAEPHVARARAAGIPVVGDIELFALYRPRQHTRLLAITGSNGKSTVTELVGVLCREAGLSTVVAGNIGLPVLTALAAIEDGERAPDVFVLELSSFQLETTVHLDADAASVLNLSQDHLDRYDSMADYAAAKARIFQGEGVQVLNRDDAHSRGMALPGRRVVTFGLTPHPTDWGLVQAEGGAWLAKGEKRLLPVAELPLAGLHNVANALAALALCQAIELPLPLLLHALRSFRGLPHRVERVAQIAGVTYYDDSKGTNVGATVAALEGLGVPVVLIAGGDGKGQDFAPLAPAVARHARAVVLIGRDAPLIERALATTRVPLLSAVDMDEAVRRAHAAARPGDAVLLSPACASFDMFRNYEHRAQVFIAAVRALAAESQP
ncbi:UDP-N-acetylmuramoyl-L-alanine--D-glutamate ligase [Thiobacter aerophilum]|uniref:UDP-N-acetylmuramoylalanine--D-glutamate ligase n=1 Tax=Thiobacter aerophilum TaxID=3121275 RepID=A0ABV0EFN1_9BURK